MAAMSGALHLSCDYVPGYGLSDSRCVYNSGVSGRTLAVFPCSTCLDHKVGIKYGRLKCVPNRWSFMCRASSGGHRRNPDFSRQNKHGFRGRNRQNEERESLDGLEDTEMLSAKNGPILSLSNSPKFQATATPGPREREIVELFRKVQAQLRARAAAKKEDKRIEEASKGRGKESETVDSLLRLLRKHSGEQSKKKVSSFNSHEVDSNQVDGDAEYGQSLVNPRNKDHNTASFNRPPSSFRRKSPVSRYKSRPTYSSEDSFDHSSSYSVTWTQKKDSVQLHEQTEYEPDPEPEPEPEPAILETEIEGPELKPESFYEDEDEEGHVTLDQISDDEPLDADEVAEDEEEEGEEAELETGGHEDLSMLKLTELRAVAKSRGVKGFSKMKKAELVEVLRNSH